LNPCSPIHCGAGEAGSSVDGKGRALWPESPVGEACTLSGGVGWRRAEGDGVDLVQERRDWRVRFLGRSV
jgi:hypothetical protein